MLPQSQARRDREARQFQVASVTRNGDGVVTSTKEVPERRDYAHPEGMVTKGRSTLVDAEGKVIQTWIKQSAEDAAHQANLAEAIEELKLNLPRAPFIPMPVEMTDDDFLAGYPVGDHHMGMLAWKHEVGASYDLSIGEDLLDRAGQHLTATMFPATHALVAFLGDFVHYDSMVPVTPQSKNQLDNEGRASKMVRAAMRTMRRLIEQAAERHKFVHVIIEFGNHDPYSTLWLMEAFRIKYEDNPRITIDCGPGFYHYHRFGKNLIGTNHGDKAKMEKLPLIMATDRAKDWGDTEHRVIWTGHIHQQKVFDLTGCYVESFRVLAPNDAWAHQMGYRSARDMKAVLFHKDYGEVARYSFNPEMLT